MAIVKPLSESGLPDLVAENVKNERVVKKGKGLGEDLDRGYDRGHGIGDRKLHTKEVFNDISFAFSIIKAVAKQVESILI